MPTLAEIDEALAHSSRIPVDERGTMWHRWVDSLLAQRARLATTDTGHRSTRVMAVSEHR
jgi:hypothetical protein